MTIPNSLIPSSYPQHQYGLEPRVAYVSPTCGIASRPKLTEDPAGHFFLGKAVGDGSIAVLCHENNAPRSLVGEGGPGIARANVQDREVDGKYDGHGDQSSVFHDDPLHRYRSRRA